MARIVVVGGGFGGMASAARLAKLGHDVTLIESGRTLGGAFQRIEQDGFNWDSGPTYTLLPAVVRDLFRKTGRPLEKELELVPLNPAAQHRFGTEEDEEIHLDLPAGSRADQQAAITAAFGERAGSEWTAYVDSFADTWECLRKDWLENPYDPANASKQTRALLGARATLGKRVQRSFKDERLRQLATWRWEMDGHLPRDIPEWAGMWSYVEQNFATWTIPGGMSALTKALGSRLQTRGVQVITDVTVTDLAIEGGRPVGARTQSGTIDADQIVVAIDPRRLPALAPMVLQTMPSIPPVVAHIGLVGDVPELPAETVIHGKTPIVVRTGGGAPDGAHAWTLHGRGALAEDIVEALQRNGIRVRDQVEVRIDRSPLHQVQHGGSPTGVLWQGRNTVARKLGPRTPIDGVYVAGAHAGPGSGIPQVGLSAALVAQEIGPA